MPVTKTAKRALRGSLRKKTEQINLLPRKGFQTSTAGRILAWILSTFRIIVIVTEIIVMIAFLSRFWFDAQNTDLNEKIQQKQAVLAASKDFELRFKDVQDRLEIFSNLTDNKMKNSEILTLITRSIPSDVILTKLAVAKESFLLTGSTSNEKSIQQLIVNLASNQNFNNLGLLGINTDTTNPPVLIFTIGANVVNGKEDK